jgi:hypothetical protein
VGRNRVEPDILEQYDGWRSLLRVFVKHSLDDGLDFAAVVLKGFGELNLLVAYLFNGLIVVLALERRAASYQLVQQYSS